MHYIANDEGTVGEPDQVGWIAGAVGLLLALIAWGREAFKKKQDITHDFGVKMLSRIVALEQRESEAQVRAATREDTLRLRIESVETEAELCARNFGILQERHGILLRDHAELREEHDKVTTAVDVLRKANTALHAELDQMYKQLGLRRTPRPFAKVPTPKLPPSTKE